MLRLILLWAVICVLSPERAVAAEACPAPIRPSDGICTEQDTEGWEEALSSYDFNELEQALQELLPDSGISFRQMVEQLIAGEITDFGEVLLCYVEDILWGEIRQSREVVWQLLLLAVVGAVFTNLARAFPDKGVSQTGFLVLYMMASALLLIVFASAVSIAAQGLTIVGKLMTAFLPVFFLAVAVQGQVTAAAMYEFSLLVLRGIQWLFEHVMVGGTRVWVLLRILEGVFTEEVLGRLAELVGKCLKGLVKTGFGAAVGFQTVQALLLPYLDAVKGGALLRLASAIPGVGNSVEAAAQMALGTAALIRNGIGMAGVLVLAAASIGPLCKLGFLALIYHGLAAVLQPVSDKRLLEAVTAVGDGCLLLLKTLGAGILLFGIAIGIVCASLGRGG